MKGYYRYILLASAALLAAASCTKPHVEENPSEPTQISISAVEGAATKALLDNGTFNTKPETKALLDGYKFNQGGNRLQIYDYVDGNYYFSDLIGPDVPGSTLATSTEGVWPFVNGPHQWTPGTHKFFGWLAKDANMATDNTPEAFFGNGFNFYGDDETETDADKMYTLTIPAKEMTVDTPQFDFMYSDIFTTEPINEPVDLTFSHLFSAFYITALNRDDANKITIKKIILSGLGNAKSATIDFSGTEPVVTYTPAADDATTPFSFTLDNELGTTAESLTDTFLIWPQTTDDFAEAELIIEYDFTSEDQTTNETKEVPLSSITEWNAGFVNSINLVFDLEQITFYIRTLEQWNTEEKDIVVEM